MDFVKYLLPIAELDKTIIDGLITYFDTVKETDPGVKKYFTASVNPDLFSISLPSKIENASDIIQKTVSKLSHIFPASSYTSCEFNTLSEGGNIVEHTDQSSAITQDGINHNFGSIVSHWHSVHIPLCGVGSYAFRREPIGKDTVHTMKIGNAYLFNNYVIHSVSNVGQGIRKNLILHFYDPDWKIKRRIYSYYSLKGYY